MNNQFLIHHGIKGQRWGQRNGPPYPLKPGMHSDSELKKGYDVSISKARAIKASRTMDDVDEIINSLSQDDKNKVLAGSNHYLNVEEGESVVKRFLTYYGEIPVAFLTF